MSASPTAPEVPGGTARVALPTGQTPNWIWPYVPRAKANEVNTEGFERLMYRPLYMFGANDNSLAVNYPLSAANAPVYSDGGTTVTITMKGWKWSDGETVGARDVIFWLNMMRAEPAGYYGYVPGQLPDNLASYRATGPNTVVLHLKSPVSRLWFTYNQLAEITPMPAAWDVTAAGATAGSGGCATDTAADHWAKCAAVFDFLTAQSTDATTYANNPLWSVVDGPWKLSSFTPAASGPVTSFVPNAAYSGSPKPQLAKLTYYAYTTDSAQYAALKSGQLDIGFIPPRDLPPVSPGRVLPSASPLGSGFTLSANYAFDIEYLLINFSSPTAGPAFKQLYVRQALQDLVDQEGMIQRVDRGYGYPTSGGIPAQPSSPWVPAVQYENGGQGPYAYSVATATARLISHGWRNVGGVMTCAAPGTGDTECGAGVAKGTQLKLALEDAAGDQALQGEVALIKADMAQAGIQVSVVSQASSTWDFRTVRGWNFSGPGFEPTGEPLFATGAASNASGYSDPTEDNLISLTHTSDSLLAFLRYASYTATQLPVIWLPNAYTVTAISGKLANVGNIRQFTLLPEYWYFTK